MLVFFVEKLDGFDFVRLQGRHGCKEIDREVRDRIMAYMQERIEQGQRRFLLDVRKLSIVYNSGWSELLPPLNEIRATARVAILWAPEPSWLQKVDEHKWAGAYMEVIGWRQLEAAGEEYMFRDPDRAVAYLSEPGSGRPGAGESPLVGSPPGC